LRRCYLENSHPYLSLLSLTRETYHYKGKSQRIQQYMMQRLIC